MLVDVVWYSYGREQRIRAVRRVAGDFLDIGVHAQQERVERMASRREKCAPAKTPLDVPAILAVPRSDTVVVVHLAVVQTAYEAGVEDRLRRDELR